MNQTDNPLISFSFDPYDPRALGALPFEQIRNEHLQPAFEAALKVAKQQLEEIKSSKHPADFENTIEGLETAGERLDLVSHLFSNLLHAETNDVLEALAKEILPRLAEYSNDISLDERLFERVKTVYEKRSELKLDGERARLLEKTYRFFVRNGALLGEQEKARLRELDKRLAVLQQQFSENVLKATNAFALIIRDRADLAGLPDSAIEAAELAARQKGHENAWLFTLHNPSYSPFMKYSQKRELREKLWQAAMSRSCNGEFDNRGNAVEIAKLRHERSRLLGYATHAHFVLEERMAGNPAKVSEFIEKLFQVSRKAAERELRELKEFSGESDLQAWDFAFYSEKLKHKKFDFNEEALKPYFQLENVLEGVFEHARRLYGIVFRERKDIPVYHPEVMAYEVRDESSGDYVGLFYADFFPRDSKQGGAWMTVFRDQGLHNGEVRRPHVSIVCNLTKPTDTRPSLLTLNEVRTIFHEFGHSLHALLSRCRYRSLGGTNVFWDFVELPSQVMENWTLQKDSLDLFARHYETGKPIPQELVEKIQANARFQAGYQSLRQISFGTLDLAWHANGPGSVTGKDVERFEKDVLARCALFPDVPGTAFSCSFTHIFSGGYSAGYYSYKWAEVLDADAFEWFKEKGLFNQEVSKRFKTWILEKGDTEHPAELYRKFRGRDPDPSALLKRDGLL